MSTLKGKKISALTEIYSVSDSTIIPVVDGSVTPTTNYIKASNLKSATTLSTDAEIDAFYSNSAYAIVFSTNLGSYNKAIFGIDMIVELHCYSIGGPGVGAQYKQEFTNYLGKKYSRTLSYSIAGPGGPAGVYPDGTFEEVIEPNHFLAESKPNITKSDLDGIVTPGSYPVNLSSGNVNGFTVFNLTVEDLNPATAMVGNIKQTIKTSSGEMFSRFLTVSPLAASWSEWERLVTLITHANCSQYQDYYIQNSDKFFSVRARGLTFDSVNLILPSASEFPGRRIDFFVELAGGSGNVQNDVISANTGDKIILKNSANGPYQIVESITMNITPGGMQWDPIMNKSFISLISDGNDWLEM